MAGARAANYDVICSADVIPTLDLQRALQRRPLRVPLLQRRYCWPGKQLHKFLFDAVRLTAIGGRETLGEAVARPPGPLIGSGHSLGRVVVSRAAAKAAGPRVGGGRKGTLVLDGQQRITTAMLLLAAIRDVLLEAAGAEQHQSTIDADPTSVDTRAAVLVLARDIDSALGVDRGGRGRSSGKPVTPAIIPTYFDRKAFENVLAGTGADELAGPDDRVTFAHSFFADALRRVTLRQVCDKLGMIPFDADAADGALVVPLPLMLAAGTALAKAVLLGFRVLWFDAHEADVWSVYERLAFREVMLGAFAVNNAPGIPLAEADLTRNFLVSFFATEQKQLEMYTMHWVPTELAAMKSGASRSGTDRPVLDVLCVEFLKNRATVDAELPAPPTRDPAGHLTVQVPSGQLDSFATYKGMRRYVESQLTRGGVPLVTEVPTEAGADVVEQVLSELAAFATNVPWAAMAAEEATAQAAAENAASGRGDHRRAGRGRHPTVAVGSNTHKYATTVIPEE
eukprot:m.313920 g.313920  ORF g.313920 m.313920 type:complete len:510 (-) comp27490_c0_seq1:1281-2810(-)